MSSPPTVSVLLPVFNGGPYLRAAMDSVLGQTFEDFELIAVDDGSRDNSLKILEEYAAEDCRIRIISRPNTGIAGALNDAINVAHGEFLARMDADDVSLPTRFEKQVAFLRQHPDVVLLGSRVLLVDPYLTPLYETNHRLTHEEIEKEMLSGVGWAVVHPSAMIRAGAVRKAGGYRPKRVPTEDLDLFLRLTEAGKAANLPDILLHYRQHPGSANHTRHQEQELLKREILAEAFGRRGLALPPGWSLHRRNILPVEKEINMWAWVALKRGNISAARKHALSLMRLAPFSFASWRLMFCAIRGY